MTPVNRALIARACKTYRVPPDRLAELVEKFAPGEEKKLAERLKKQFAETNVRLHVYAWKKYWKLANGPGEGVAPVKVGPVMLKLLQSFSADGTADLYRLTRDHGSSAYPSVRKLEASGYIERTGSAEVSDFSGRRRDTPRYRLTPKVAELARLGIVLPAAGKGGPPPPAPAPGKPWSGVPANLREKASPGTYEALRIPISGESDVLRLLGQLLGGEGAEAVVTTAPGGKFLEIRRAGSSVSPTPTGTDAGKRVAQLTQERDQAYAALADLRKKYQELEARLKGAPAATNGPRTEPPAVHRPPPTPPGGRGGGGPPSRGPSPEVERVVGALAAPAASPRPLPRDEAKAIRDELTSLGPQDVGKGAEKGSSTRSGRLLNLPRGPQPPSAFNS